MKIMLDVDSILYDAGPIFVREAKVFGVNWPARHNFWVNRQQLGIDSQTMSMIFDRVHCAECVMPLAPYEGSVEGLQRLTNEFSFLEPWYVSNRNPTYQQVLEDWLEFNEFPYAKNVYTSYNKLLWIEENEPEIVVDDRVRTLVTSCLLYGARGFSIAHPHNENLKNDEIKGITICENWEELTAQIYDFILEKAEVMGV